MMCNCIEKVSNAIREDYEDPEAELDTIMVMQVDAINLYPRLAATYRPKKKDGTFAKVKMVGIRPTYCPFCGVKYNV
jgi:hypothetical protein